MRNGYEERSLLQPSLLLATQGATHLLKLHEHHTGLVTEENRISSSPQRNVELLWKEGVN